MTPGSEEAVVDLRGGSVAIAGRPVVRGVDLVVGSGEFLALMGANGSGKSTLVKGLTGLRPLTVGTLRLFGTPIGDFRDWNRVGFVPQRTGASSGVPSSVWEVPCRRQTTNPASKDSFSAETPLLRREPSGSLS